GRPQESDEGRRSRQEIAARPFTIPREQHDSARSPCWRGPLRPALDCGRRAEKRRGEKGEKGKGEKQRKKEGKKSRKGVWSRRDALALRLPTNFLLFRPLLLLFFLLFFLAGRSRWRRPRTEPPTSSRPAGTTWTCAGVWRSSSPPISGRAASSKRLSRPRS